MFLFAISPRKNKLTNCVFRFRALKGVETRVEILVK